MCNYKDFLAAKPMYYAHIDYERFPRAWAALRGTFKFELPPVIHVVGTNGKGSTGRFLAMILRASGRRVGHYTSPHLTEFRERFWLDGRLASDEEIQKAHEKLLSIFSNLNKENNSNLNDKNTQSNSNLNCNEDFISNLSYFEWATLLAVELFKDCDEIVMEAGLGGEYDATNAFAKKLSIFTPVGLDHVAMLGDTLAKIATTKLNSMDKKAILCASFAEPEIAAQIAAQKDCELKTAPAALLPAVREYALKFELPDFLADNLNLAAEAASELGVSNLNEIISNLGALDLPGRVQKIRPNLWLDVGHNAHAARAIATHFNSNLKGQKLTLIYNAFDDKDVNAALLALAPVLGKIEVYPYESKERALAGEKIALAASNLNIPCGIFSHLNADEPTLVFGSFMLVSEFARRELEK